MSIMWEDTRRLNVRGVFPITQGKVPGIPEKKWVVGKLLSAYAILKSSILITSSETWGGGGRTQNNQNFTN